MIINSRYFPPAEVRFWRFVNKTDGCWLWTGGKSRGYGAFGVAAGNIVGAHRWSYEAAYGPIPPGMDVCHRCDTPACVRPDHLFVGTRKDNMQDAKSKGRARGNNPKGKNAGVTNGMAKLTPGIVQEIRRRRASGEKLIHIARDFGVTVGTVSNIARRMIWKHVVSD